ncbi:hypothetical protein LJB86_04655 [Deltaproteobacteria bacterium OttesenSCG-928-M10]|nr:hypothetical protein [Deltaproteobacteria bacterium OttesenSCG-928-M10]
MLTDSDLQLLGLNKNAAAVYMKLLHAGSLNATELANAASISRTNVYNLIEQLVAEDLVTVDFKGSKKRFTAKDPSIFQKKLEDQLSRVNQLLPELLALYHLTPSKPKISYHEGSDGVRAVTDDLLTTKTGKYCYFGSLLVQFGLEGSNHIKEFITRRIQLGVESYAIRPREAEPILDDPWFLPGAENLRHVRYFPKPIPPNMLNLYIYDIRIAVVSSASEKYGLIIESPELASLLQTIWDIVWEISLEK